MWKWNPSFIILYCFFVFFPWGCFVVFWEIFQAKPVLHLIRVQFVENCLQHRLWKKRNIYNHNKKNFKLICFLQTTFSSSKKLSGFVMWTVIWFMNKNLKLSFVYIEIQLPIKIYDVHRSYQPVWKLKVISQALNFSSTKFWDFWSSTFFLATENYALPKSWIVVKLEISEIVFNVLLYVFVGKSG